MSQVVTIGTLRLFPIKVKEIYREIDVDLIHENHSPRAFERGEELPGIVLDRLIRKIDEYIIARRRENPNFHLYISCECRGTNESTIGKVVAGNTGYLFIEPLNMVDEEDDPRHFTRYEIELIHKEDRFYKDEDMPWYVQEIGDYYHVFKGIYTGVSNNKSAKGFLEMM